jgi:hypothetical protein
MTEADKKLVQAADDFAAIPLSTATMKAYTAAKANLVKVARDRRLN